ncbi:hypothetical protein MSG28_014518 [Choristoneura fumiferana]|uniref:Uncharacterized protein n=1 Tax=Choristoneura fumiferana TaxID=7141 RepID=A0ACC0JRN6_CHOFU|nr:hypothetical protein MSG28_014518 [Choristoneura fumiferana]
MNLVAKRNATVILKHSSAYPFQQTSNILRCCFCLDVYEKPQEFREHMDSQHPNIDKSDLPSNLSDNLVRVDITDLHCTVCSAGFEKLDDLAAHLVEHDLDIDNTEQIALVPFKLDSDRFVCVVCEKVFPGFFQLSRHTVTHFSNYACIACECSFETLSGLRYHEIFSHKASKNTCRVCMKSFSTRDEKKKHVKETPACMPAKCYICKERLPSWDHKEKHLIEMHDILGWSRDAAKLNAQIILRHSTAYPFLQSSNSLRCCFCPEVFNDPTLFRAHMDVIHMGVDRSTCNKANLDTQTRVDVTNLRCAKCIKKFTSIEAVAKHLHDEHELEIQLSQSLGLVPLKLEKDRFECVVCSQKFTSTMQVSRHTDDEQAAARRNGQVVVQFTTAYPFKIPESSMVCVYCCDGFEDPIDYRKHMEDEHKSFKVNLAFIHCDNDAYLNAKRNAEIIVKYSTAYPFRLPENSMVCVYCCEGFDDPTLYRKHMSEEHETFKVRMAFVHCSEGFIKADCTELRCRLCSESFDTLEAVASHLHLEHDMKLNLNFELGMQPFKLEKDKLLCAMCDMKFPCIRQLSRHTQSHFLKHTCDTCGKSYATITTLKNHIRFSHADKKSVSNATIERRNAELIVLYSTAYPFRLPGKLMVCVYCCEKFEDPSMFRLHMDGEHQQFKVWMAFVHVSDGDLKVDCTDLRCRTCSQHFPKLEDVAEHLLRVHNHPLDLNYYLETGEISRFRMAKRNAEVILQYSTVYPFRLRSKSMFCVYCDDEFEDPAEFRTHAVKCQRSFPFAKAFAYSLRNQEHLKVECSDISCRVCNTPYHTLEEMAQHIFDNHENTTLNLTYGLGLQPYKLDQDKWHCFICQKKFPSLTKLGRHTPTHYRKCTCEICGRTYLTKEALKYHMRCSHSDNHACRKCWQEFPSLEEKKEHIRSSKPCWPFCCVYCGDRFLSWENKQKHLVEAHARPKKTYKCPDCDKTYDSRKLFYSHYKLTHTDETFTCSCCGLKFESKKTLEDHRIGHTGEKLFKCSVCLKSFSRDKSLKQHMWIHRYTLEIRGRNDSEREPKPKIVLVYQTPQRRNAELILRFSTAYPFKTRFTQILCAYCLDEFDPLSNLRCEKCGTTFISDHALRDHHRQVKCCRTAYKARNGRVMRSRRNAELILQWSTACPFRTWKRPKEKAERTETERKSKKRLFERSVNQNPQRQNAVLILKYSTAFPFKTRFNRIVCSYCHDEFEPMTALRTHIKTEHANADYNSAFYKVVDGLKIDITEFKCNLCSQDIQSVEVFMNHLSGDHGKTVNFEVPFGVLPYRQGPTGLWMCLDCDKTFSEFSQINGHLRSHVKIFTCEKCGATFLSEHGLRQHERNFKCYKATYKPRFGKALKHRSNTEIILQCSTARPFRTWGQNFNCVFCRVQSNDPNGLRMHMAARHANFNIQHVFSRKLRKEFLKVDITDLQCKLCYLRIDSLDDLITHLKNDHKQPINADVQPGVLPFKLNDGSHWKCAICTCQFSDFISLKKHTAEHFQNFVCDTCGEGFITESALIAHTKIPHDNKYSCSRCVATFSTLEERNVHIKTQHTTLPYMCAHCKDKPRFATWELRKRHLMEFHNYKPGAEMYECTTCHMTFKTRSQKYHHNVKAHRTKKETEYGYPCGSSQTEHETMIKVEATDVPIEHLLKEKPRYQRSARAEARLATKKNATAILECWSVVPFRWKRNQFKCAYCEANFTDCNLLRLHVATCSSQHSVKDIYSKFKEMSLINIDVTGAVCRLCSMPYADVKQMREHVIDHGYNFETKQPDGVLPFCLDKESWRCVICQEKFNNFLKLYEHMNVHYQHYICATCGKGYMTAPRLRKHSEVHISGLFPCNECVRTFKMRAARDHHKAHAHAKAPRYECPQCNMRFDGYYDRSASAVAEAKVGVRRVRKLKENVSARQMRRRRRANNELPEESEKRISKTMMRRNAMTLLECSTAWAFRWFHSAFYCSYCDAKFVDTAPLQSVDHKLKWKPKRKYKDHRDNAAIIIECSNVCPFRWKRGAFTCAFCPISFGDFSSVREHALEHPNRVEAMRLARPLDNVKVEISGLRCELCLLLIKDVETLKDHLLQTHNKPISNDHSIGITPFLINGKDFLCTH